MPLHRLRRYASAVLLSFIATACVALLAPLIQAVGYQSVCSANGHRFVAVNGERVDLDDSSRPFSDLHDDGAAHCPLCMPAAPPPAIVPLNILAVQPLAFVLQSIPAARLAGLVGAPLPARGPPLT